VGERATRIAAWVALAIQPVFFAYWLIAGAVEPHYSPTREYVSEMGASTAARPWLLDLMLVLWGISILAAAFALRRTLNISRVAWPVGLLVLAGVADALAGPIHLSCAASVHPGCAGSHSFLHEAHNRLAEINQVALTLSAAALAFAQWPRLAGKLLIVPSLFALAFLAAGLSADAHDPHAGLAQRIGFVAAQGWIMVLAVGALFAEERTRVRARTSG
jgi:hypothetical protein